MLEPAIVHKEKLLALFAKEIYTDDYFLYAGYPHCVDLPKIEAQDNVYQWAIMDGDKVVGYFAYRIDPVIDCAKNFGLYSFDRGNQLIGTDVFRKMEELVARHHRVEWCVIAGNPVTRHYDAFCQKHHGYKVTLHDITKAPDGTYRDEYRYEIIKKQGGSAT